jgi:hypothetical protein
MKNNQKLIMENWRKYCDKQVMNKVYLLKEGKVQKETSLTLLIERRERGEINFEEMIDILNESVVYETKQFIKEAEEAEAGPKQGKKEKKAFGYKIREKAYKFVYSKLGGYLSSLKDSGKAPTKKAVAHMEQIKAALKSGDKKALAALLSEKAFRALLAGFKMIIRGIGKIVKVLWGVIKAIGRFMKHPIVRVIMIAGLALMLAQVATIGAGAAVTWKMGNHVSALTTGRTLTGHAVRAAIGAAKDAIVSEGLMDIADILGDLGVDEVGAAIIKLAESLEDQEVWSTTEMSSMEFQNSAGEIISSDTFNIEYADQALGNQMQALGVLKNTLKGMEGDEGLAAMLESGVPEDVGRAMKSALNIAAQHCKSDPAACVGANHMADSIKISWSGQVNSEIFQKMSEWSSCVGGQCEGVWSQLLSTASTQIGAQTVTGLPTAPEQLEEWTQWATKFKTKIT